MRLPIAAAYLLTVAALSACSQRAENGDAATGPDLTIAAPSEAAMDGATPALSSTPGQGSRDTSMGNAELTVARIEAGCRKAIESQLSNPSQATITFSAAVMSDGREATVIAPAPGGGDVTNNYACNVESDGSIKAVLKAG